MKAQSISVLVIDKDPESAKAMAFLVKDLFSKVHIQSELKKVPEDLLNLEPAVVLISLTISQRAENLELAEIINKSAESPLLLGFSDSHETELLAHALESGFQDLFMRPFDEDLIASKINKFIQHENTLKHDLAYSTLRPLIHAKVRFHVRLIGCDENGITMEGDHYISKGTTIALPGVLSRKLTGSEKTEFIVTRTWTGNSWDKQFFYAEMKSPDEMRSAALRNFINGKKT